VEQFGFGMGTRNEVKKILVMGEEAILITNATDYNMVQWYKDKCIYRITGQTSEEEFMKMLESLKFIE
jgi:exoribonuclease R